MRYIITIYLFSFIFLSGLQADEGMWLPFLMSNSQIAVMQQRGLEIPFDTIYNEQDPSLKDAIVSLDHGSCTGEFISREGLLLTNHHCGYEEIQQHSSISHNYLEDGFWARNRSEELPNPGKTATLLIEAHDITDQINKNLSEDLSEKRRQSVIDSVITLIETEAALKSGYDAAVKPFFKGNTWFLFLTQTYSDVRLVGAPPSSIGKFGGETDNYMWPRHTGDFCFFRVYCAPDGSPAEYAAENIPFRPKKHLNISLSGIQENDYTMVLGYPGETNRFLTSHGVEEIQSAINPVITEVRGIKQDIWKKEMLASPDVEIKYAAKYSQSSNYWKYSIGQNMGLTKLNTLEQRKTEETEFKKWVDADSSRIKQWSKTLPIIQASYLLGRNLTEAEHISYETLITGTDLTLIALTVSPYVIELSMTEKNSDAYHSLLSEARTELRKLYRDFDARVDQKLLTKMIGFYLANIPENLRVAEESLLGKKFIQKHDAFSAQLFKKTMLTDSTKIFELIEKADTDLLYEDPGLRFAHQVLANYYQLVGLQEHFDVQKNKQIRKYIEGKMIMDSHHDFYPDANSTMRITYGQINSYYPKNGVKYKHQTTLSGVFEKVATNNPDYTVSQRLQELYDQKDYGSYALKDGRMPLCFITDNDISGGNSGSPVLDKKGNLIGLAFDSNWEAMTGDLTFEQDLQKCICLDIRYILFIVDKYAKASHLIEEISIDNSDA
ncbi:MAG: S46 family peptidase [Marinilabiliaceae bacterium]|nr:S46 family peptidase [Marinilabiliaceae bacterium]